QTLRPFTRICRTLISVSFPCGAPSRSLLTRRHWLRRDDRRGGRGGIPRAGVDRDDHHARPASRLDIRRWYSTCRVLEIPASANVCSGVTVSSISSLPRAAAGRIPRENSAYVTAILGSLAISARYQLRRSEEHTSELQSRVDLVC